MQKNQIVIVGCGFAGLHVATGLRRAKAEVLVVDRTNHHLFQPLLYQVASAALSAADIAVPVREIFTNDKNIRVVMGDVVAIDTHNRHIVMGNGDRMGYDYLILAVGASHSYFGQDGWAQFAPGLKTLSDAVLFREHILTSFEKAERLEAPEHIAPYLNFVIVGGGPTGVEMAGAIAEVAYKTMFKDFRKIHPRHSKIYLVEAMPYLLPAYSEKLRTRAQRDLEKMGVIVMTGKKVTEIHEHGVAIEGEWIRSKNVLWAAGNQASPLLRTLAVPLDRQGRVVVEPDLSVPGHPEIFVLGDAACALGKEGKPLPGIASVAIQQGTYVARILQKQLPREARAPFVYVDKGSMATIGRFKAVAKIGKWEFGGVVAWMAWCLIHILYLIGFQNRLRVALSWAWLYVSGRRGARLIYRVIEKDLPQL